MIRIAYSVLPRVLQPFFSAPGPTRPRPVGGPTEAADYESNQKLRGQELEACRVVTVDFFSFCTTGEHHIYLLVLVPKELTYVIGTSIISRKGFFVIRELV